MAAPHASRRTKADIYEYVETVPKPDRTHHAPCGCLVGIVRVGASHVLVDAIGSGRLDDGRIKVILAPHDCARARARQRPDNPGPVPAVTAVAEMLDRHGLKSASAYNPEADS